MAVKDVAIKSFGVKGFIPLSMLDWEGRLVTTIFMGNCNFRCPFCHNASLVLDYQNLPDISRDTLKDILTPKDGWVDGVCITGGEPTLSSSLPELARFIKNLGLQVKLDTNGTQPRMLKSLIDEKLIAAVALDIKTSFSKYPLATQRPDLSDKVKQSIGLLVEAESNGNLEVEFRTTVVPTFVESDDVLETAAYLAKAGAKHYYLQQYNPKVTLEPSAANIKPLSKDFLADLAQKASKFLPVHLRS